MDVERGFWYVRIGHEHIELIDHAKIQQKIDELNSKNDVELLIKVLAVLAGFQVNDRALVKQDHEALAVLC